MTDAELRSLILDCLKLWGVSAKVTAGDTGLAIETPGGVITIARAEPELRPVRWFYQTPERAAAHRPARATPSIGALLSALRNAMGAASGDRLRIGGG